MMQGGASCRRYAESRTVQLIVIAARRNGCAACGRNERMREIGVDRVFENGAPGTIRTSDPQIRSLMLYPAELRARFSRLTGVRFENPARKVKAADTPAGLAK